jgi:hypothetical protein
VVACLFDPLDISSCEFRSTKLAGEGGALLALEFEIFLIECDFQNSVVLRVQKNSCDFFVEFQIRPLKIGISIVSGAFQLFVILLAFSARWCVDIADR